MGRVQNPEVHLVMRDGSRLERSAFVDTNGVLKSLMCGHVRVIGAVFKSGHFFGGDVLHPLSSGSVSPQAVCRTTEGHFLLTFVPHLLCPSPHPWLFTLCFHVFVQHLLRSSDLCSPPPPPPPLTLTGCFCLSLAFFVFVSRFV